MDFEQMVRFAQPFVKGDIIRVQAAAYAGEGETEENFSIGHISATNICTGEKYRVEGTRTGVRYGEDNEYEIVEYLVSDVVTEEGVYKASLRDGIYHIRDVEHKEGSILLFKIISQDAAKDTVCLSYTNRINEFDAAFAVSQSELIRAKIENDEREGTNMIQSGESVEFTLTARDYPAPTHTFIDQITSGGNISLSEDLRYPSSAIRFLNYRNRFAQTGKRTNYYIRFDQLRAFDSSGAEITGDFGYSGALKVSATWRYTQGTSQRDTSRGTTFAQFLPATNCQFAAIYASSWEPAEVNGEVVKGIFARWFFGSEQRFNYPVTLRFTNLMITPVTFAQDETPPPEGMELNASQMIPYEKSLEEQLQDIVNDTVAYNRYFDFRFEGGFLPSENNFPVDTNDFRDQRYTQTQLSALPYKVKTLTAGSRAGVPYWVGEKINLIFSCSSVHIGKLEYVRSEGSEPEVNQINELYPLYVYKIALEVKDNYNVKTEYNVDEEAREILDRIERDDRWNTNVVYGTEVYDLVLPPGGSYNLFTGITDPGDPNFGLAYDNRDNSVVHLAYKQPSEWGPGTEHPNPSYFWGWERLELLDPTTMQPVTLSRSPEFGFRYWRGNSQYIVNAQVTIPGRESAWVQYSTNLFLEPLPTQLGPNPQGYAPTLNIYRQAADGQGDVLFRFHNLMVTYVSDSGLYNSNPNGGVPEGRRLIWASTLEEMLEEIID